MERRTRILAVDDEQRGVELVKRILRSVADVEIAMSGEEGWELLQASDFDLVISDQRMPGISGVELLAKVAETSPDTGRILLTGYADTVDTVDAMGSVNGKQINANPHTVDVVIGHIHNYKVPKVDLRAEIR